MLVPSSKKKGLSGNAGSAIVFALMSIVLIGALATVTFSRTSFSEERSGKARNKDRAELAADASLQMAIRQIQRVGSASSDERTCSVLDGPLPPGVNSFQNCLDKTGDEEGAFRGLLNGQNKGDGEYNYTIRGGGDMSVPLKMRLQRKITAYGYYKDQKVVRTLRFQIVPRAYRYALYANGGVEVKNGGHMLLPPAYKSAPDSRGGDVGSNGLIRFNAGALVNDRNRDKDLYDNYFLPQGQGGTGVQANYFNGRPWGGVSRPIDTSKVQYPSPTVMEDFPSTDGKINFDGDVMQLANNTLLPNYTTLAMLDDFRAKAKSNTRNSSGSAGGSVYTPAEFQTRVNAGTTLQGLVYVDGGNGSSNCEITINSSFTIDGRVAASANGGEGGGLILHGCDLNIGGAGSLRVRHSMQTRTHESHKLPGLMVLRNTNDLGGNLKVSSSGGSKTVIDGTVYTDGNIDLEPSVKSSSDNQGNLTVNGSVVAGGKFTFGPGTSGNALIRWNPLAQNTAFDTANGQMGTYSIKTDDRPPPGTPMVALTGALPSNPNTNTFADFQWAITGDADTVECKLTGVGSPMPTFTDCSSPPGASFSNLKPYAQYTFEVEVCNVTACDTDSHTWGVNPPAAEVDILSKPSNPQAGSSNTQSAFTWQGRGAIETMQCKMDSGAFENCGTADINNVSSNHSKTYSNLARNSSHTFTVRVCNVTGCDQESYTWTINSIAPSIAWNTRPANPTPYTGSTVNNFFSWTQTGGDATVSAECRFDSGGWGNCDSLTQTSKVLSACASHTVDVRTRNTGGYSNTLSYTWTNACGAPQIAWNTRPADPTAVGAGATSVNNFFSWTQTGGSAPEAAECAFDMENWSRCDSLTQTSKVLSACASHTVYVRTSNPTGGFSNVLRYTWSNACSAPQIAWNTLPSNPHPVAPGATSVNNFFSWTQTGGSASTSAECAVDSENWGSCDSLTQTSRVLSACASHTVFVRTRNAGGYSNVLRYTWSNACGITVPQIAWERVPPGSDYSFSTSGSYTAYFSWRLTGGSTQTACEYSLDYGTWRNCNTLTNTSESPVNTSYETSHNMRVQVSNSAGYSNVLSYNWTVYECGGTC